jgi:hypothetical protein
MVRFCGFLPRAGGLFEVGDGKLAGGENRVAQLYCVFRSNVITDSGGR